MQDMNEKEIVDAVRESRARNSPIEIVGRGTKRGIGRTNVGIPLDVSGLSGIVSYEPEEMIVTALPGTTIKELQAVLAERGQRLGFDPPEWAGLLGRDGESSLGGVVSVDAAGPARLRFGGARDHLLGIRAVNGFGEAFKAGGRVVKNVTGFDIPKLVCGAFGTLCVLTELTFRVFPKQARAATFAVCNVAPEAGLAALRRVWSSPLESSGLAYVPESAALRSLLKTGAGTALVRVDGSARALEAKISHLRDLLAGSALKEIEEGDALFSEIGDGRAFSKDELDVWRIFVPPSRALALLSAIEPSVWIGDWAGGHLWAGFATSDRAATDRFTDALASAGAEAVLVRSATGTHTAVAPFQPEDATRIALMRSVKAAFDPDLLFNHGRMFEGI